MAGVLVRGGDEEEEEEEEGTRRGGLPSPPFLPLLLLCCGMPGLAYLLPFPFVFIIPVPRPVRPSVPSSPRLPPPLANWNAHNTHTHSSLCYSCHLTCYARCPYIHATFTTADLAPGYLLSWMYQHNSSLLSIEYVIKTKLKFDRKMESIYPLFFPHPL